MAFSSTWFNAINIIQEEINSLKDAFKNIFKSFTITPLTEDFFITLSAKSSELMYLTDSYKTIDIQSFCPITIQDLNEVAILENSIFITGNFYTNSFILALDNCSIFNGELKIGSSRFLSLSTIGITKIHGLRIYKDRIYISSRHGGVSLPQQFAFIYAWDFSYNKTLSLPLTTGYLGGATDIQIYKENLYTVMSTGSPGLAYCVKIDLSLTTFSTVFSTGTVTAERVKLESPFIIYKDLIYIPTVQNNVAGFNKLGFQVFNVNTGVLVKSVLPVDVISGGYTNTPFSHWLALHNGKLIVTCSTNPLIKFIARFDEATLAFEESKILPCLITDDNTILRNGMIYLCGEDPTNGVNAKLITMYYKDFLTTYKEDPKLLFNGYGSFGAINYNIPKYEI